MSRRLDVEITSIRDDGSFTWRQAGARQPKGEAAASLLPEGTKVGDRLRFDADYMLDGIELVGAVKQAAERKGPTLLEVRGPANDGPLITTQMAPKGRRDRGDRRRGERGRGERRERDGHRFGGGRDGAPGRDRAGGRGDRPGQRGERGDRGRRPAPPPLPEKPKAKRLRARRVHRDAFVAGLPVEQQPIVEQLQLGGIPAVRQAIEKQNAENKAAGRPEVHAAELLTLAENLSPRLKEAEWRDKADAALADVEELDLRDLRSVVVAADGSAVDDESRAIAATLRTALSERVDREQAAWLEEIGELIKAGRTIRALRQSSRPPKAGSPIPPEVAKELADATVASVDDDTTQQRWGAVLDALAFSPVRGLVKFPKVPEEPNEELLTTVKSVADRLPEIAAQFGIDPASLPRSAKTRRPKPARGPRSGAAPATAAPSPGAIPPPPPAATPPEPTPTEPTPSEPASAEATQAEVEAIGSITDAVIEASPSVVEAAAEAARADAEASAASEEE